MVHLPNIHNQETFFGKFFWRCKGFFEYPRTHDKHYHLGDVKILWIEDLGQNWGRITDFSLFGLRIMDLRC